MKFGINTFLFVSPGRLAAIWRRIEPTQNEVAIKGLKFLKNTL